MQDDKEKLLQLGNHIKHLRKGSNLTIEALCYKNGLEPSTISRIENGIENAGYLTLLKLANAFNITLSELLNF